MRILISFILISIFTNQSYSQKKIVTYYDKLWRLTTKDFAEYSRISNIDTVKYQYSGEVKDFYINGNLQMKGKYQNNVKVDRFLFYYPNGNLMTSGFYKDNSRWGIWTNFYENGNVRDKIAFNKDFLGALEYYNENGDTIIKNGTGLWQTQFLNDFTYKSGSVKGEFKDSLRHGTWNYYTMSLIPELNEEIRLMCK